LTDKRRPNSPPALRCAPRVGEVSQSIKGPETNGRSDDNLYKF
jgi:hypothetical protein